MYIFFVFFVTSYHNLYQRATARIIYNNKKYYTGRQNINIIIVSPSDLIHAHVYELYITRRCQIV